MYKRHAKALSCATNDKCQNIFSHTHFDKSEQTWDPTKVRRIFFPHSVSLNFLIFQSKLLSVKIMTFSDYYKCIKEAYAVLHISLFIFWMRSYTLCMCIFSVTVTFHAILFFLRAYVLLNFNVRHMLCVYVCATAQNKIL